MQCSQETFLRLFYNSSSFFQLLFLFIYVSSIVFPKLFLFLGGNIFFHRNHDEYEYGVFSDEEEEEEDEYYCNQSEQNDHLTADVVHGSETNEEFSNCYEHFFHDEEEPEENSEKDEICIYSSLNSESGQLMSDEDILEEFPKIDSDSVYDSETNDSDVMSQVTSDHTQYASVTESDICQEKCDIKVIKEEKVEMENNNKFKRDENYLVFAPSKLESKKIKLQEKDEGEIFGDSCTNGSTSKSSSEWRSSINCSGTEDPFSSSSRRSCPNWESYTVFQKYDEEMLFLDRVSAQKLSETESLRSIQACPRSISERIVHKIATTRHKNPSNFRHNPYHELEAAYVAQISWTWEALSWNYKYFQRLRESRRNEDPGCPAHIAQQFQQFQVLLQRYIENEPYEYGRRPEIYARMRKLAPRLLQVPEYRDSEEEEEKKDDQGLCSRISSDSFVQIMEESIKTFMNFLKADKENRCQILLAAFFKKNRRGSADPALLLLLKKINSKKKMKIKDIRRSRKCLTKRKVKVHDEMEILMAQIDLKVVSRVLRMSELNDEQLHWCEDKMSKVRICDGKLHRDSSPLFFPAH